MTWAQRRDDGGISVVTLSAPDRLNAFGRSDIVALREVLRDLAADPDIGAVVLTGAGRGFCAGGDLHAIRSGDHTDRDPAGLVAAMRELVEVVEQLQGMPKLTVAAVNGPCAGAGLSLAAAADVRCAARSAVFTTAFVKVGQSGDYGSSWLLSRLLGAGAARRLMLLSERVEAEEALRVGLVDEVVDDAVLLTRAMALAASSVALPRAAVAAIKANLADATTLSLRDYLDVECERFVGVLRSPESRDAVAAYLDGR